MAKDPEKKPDEKPWTPDQPLEDEEDEKEVQRHARAKAREGYLVGELTKPPEKKPGERKKLFG